MREDEEEAKAAFSELGTAWPEIALTPDRRRLILAFFRTLLQWNARINLTGARTLEDLIGEHLPDSLAMTRLVPSGSHLIDVGSGGGLPTIPFALLRPDCSVALVEPRAKRAAFLRTAVREMGLAAEVLNARIEDLARGGEFDVASSRATFPPDEWLPIARGLLRQGGRALVFAAAPPKYGSHTPFSTVEEIAYATRSGHPRWAAAYCST